MISIGKLSEEFLSHDIVGKLQDFRCSDEKQVEYFIKEEAYNLVERNFVRTRLFFDENQNLIGFYSLFNDTIKLNGQKKQELGIRPPNGIQDIPAIRLHYIGVDDRYRLRGYGKHLMTSALYYCAKVSRISGCALITLESTEKAKGFYEKFQFKYIYPVSKYYFMAYNTKSLLEMYEEK